MTTDPTDGLPEALKSVRTRALFVMHLDVRPLQMVGATPAAYRRVGVIAGGSFVGERLRGKCWKVAATGRACVRIVPPRWTCGWF